MVTFVGRRDELRQLRSALAAAAAGEPRLVLISGPPGIGKTALVQELLRDPGTLPPPRVLRASGDEGETLWPHGVVDQLLAGAGAPPARREQDTVEDPISVGARLLQELDRAEDAPVTVLVVDDAQWADLPSLRALVFVLRRLAVDRVLAVVATRDEPGAVRPDGLERLAAGPRGLRLPLSGLDAADLSQLAQALGVGALRAPAAHRLQANTHGNPLHAKAILEESPRQAWSDDAHPVSAPRSFRRMVQDRYGRAEPDTQRLLDAAAVVGQQSSVAVVAGLAGVEDPLPAIDEAARSDLLHATSGREPWSLTFSHPLVRAAVLDALPPARRHALHTAAAAVMTDEASALRHRVAAALGPDPDLAADLADFAEREMRRQAWQSAAAHAAAASRLSPDSPQAQRRLLRAVVWTILRGDAATAATLAAGMGPGATSGLAELVVGVLAVAADDPLAAERALSAAWAGASGEDQELVGIVALMTAIHRYGRLDGQATVDWAGRALAALPAQTSMAAVAQTYLLHGLGYAGRTGDATAAALAAESSWGHADVDSLWLNPRGARGLLRLVEDDLPGARTDLASVAVAAQRLGILNTASFAYAYLARAEWVAGAWDDAVLHAERAMAINLESDLEFLHLAITGIAVLVPAARGDFATAGELIASMERGAGGYERSTVALAMSRARVGEARGDHAAVHRALLPVVGFGRRDAADEPGFWSWPDLYADALVGLGRAAEADTFLAPHEELADERGRRSVHARLARARGRIEAALGRPERAEAAFERGLAALAGLELPFEQARLELAYGSFLRRSNRRRRAADQLLAAQERFRRLGAEPYLARCGAELAACGRPTHSRRDGTTGLTSQEAVVATLAAAGRSNRQIADELFVSVKTVEYHLRNTFTKLGVASRRELPERLEASDAAGSTA